MDYDPQLQQGKWGLQLSNVPHFLLTSRVGIRIPAIPGAEAGGGGGQLGARGGWQTLPPPGFLVPKGSHLLSVVVRFSVGACKHADCRATSGILILQVWGHVPNSVFLISSEKDCGPHFEKRCGAPFEHFGPT